MARQVKVKQGSPSWHIERLGIPTASEFSKIITPKKMDLSSQADEYANLKISEIMTGESQGLIMPTFHMERGQLTEREARDAYEFAHDVTTLDGGFWTDDKKRFGASPDFLIGKNGIGEIKCLDGKQHIKYLLENKVKDYFMPQIQGQLYVCEREFCDWWMYHPALPRVGIRVYRDENYISKLENALMNFREIMNNKIERLQELGHWYVADQTTHQEDYYDNETGEFYD